MSRQLIAKAPESAINQLTSNITGVDTDHLIEEVRTSGVEYGLQRNYVEDLEHERKIIIARLMEHHRTDQKNNHNNAKPTVQQLDNLARSDKQYSEFLQVLKAAKDQLTHKESSHFSKRHKLDMLLEQMKLARAEMHYLQQSSQTL